MGRRICTYYSEVSLLKCRQEWYSGGKFRKVSSFQGSRIVLCCSGVLVRKPRGTHDVSVTALGDARSICV